MARERARRQRGFSPLIPVIAVFVMIAGALAGCEAPSRPGWHADASLPPLVVAKNVTSLQIDVVLPEGYEAAEGFVQRATFTVEPTDSSDPGSPTVSTTADDLRRAFTITLPGGTWTRASLELMIGFCRPDEKDRCFIDTATLAIDRRDGDGTGTVHLTYEPETPR